MRDESRCLSLLASESVRLIAAIRSSLLNGGIQVHNVVAANTALEAIRGPRVPSLLLLDAELPGMPIAQLLAAIHAGGDEPRFPIVIITDDGIPEWRERLAEGTIDNILPRNLPPFHWQAQVEIVLRTFRRMRELELLRRTATSNREIDPRTGLLNRAALLSMLFCETDRVQRMNTSLTVMRFDIDDVSHWHERLGESAWDDVAKEAARRVQRLLRTYDVIGRVGIAGFALGLPGCAPVNAVTLAERIRGEVFAAPFRAEGAAVRLTASYGIAASHGRSPLIVLRDAEQALQAAKAAGPDEIRSAQGRGQPPAPAAFLSPVATTDRLTR
jgi:diguanylate cyclase (GGDEF)-like protein